MGKYDGIISMEHFKSDRHPAMPQSSRAAQFSPFAALTGYDEEIAEAGRLTEERPQLDEDMKNILDSRLASALRQQLEISVTYFIPDAVKDGGSFRTVEARAMRLAGQASVLVMDDGERIPIKDITDIRLLTSSLS